MHFFGYRSCVKGASGNGRRLGSQEGPLAEVERVVEMEDGPPSRLVLLNDTDEYRVVWDGGRLPRSYEVFVNGSDRRGTILISRLRDGSLAVVARALPRERPIRSGERPSGTPSDAIWAIRAREDARWEPAGGTLEVRIDLSRDSGVTWESLFKEEPTGGPETWSVSGPMRANCRIRIRTMED